MSNRTQEEASPSTRERVFETASSLFYRFGYQAVGVNRIADESGVGKMTLYRYFPSKDDLIIEHLERSAQEFWEWFEAAVAEADNPRDRLISVFNTLEVKCRSARCVGCTFQSAAAEFPGRDHPANKIARGHKESIRGRMESLVEEMGIQRYDAVANQLMLLMEGAWAATRTLSLPTPAREVASAARFLLDGRLYAESVNA